MRYRERPTGIAVVSIIWWTFSGLTILFGLAVIGLGSAIASVLSGFGAAGGTAFVFFLLFGVAFIAVGLLGIAVGAGLWRLETWAWWGAIVLTSLVLLFEFFLFGGLPIAALTSFGLLALLLQIGSLIYLCLPEARDACGIGSPGRERRRVSRKPTRELRCPNPSCGRELRPHWEYCPYCMTRLSARRSPARIR